jgi:hypothetical protein
MVIRVPIICFLHTFQLVELVWRFESPGYYLRTQVLAEEMTRWVQGLIAVHEFLDTQMMNARHLK